MQLSLRAMLSVFVLAVTSSDSPADDLHLIIEAGDHDRHSAPIVVELPEVLADAEDLELVPADSQKPLPLQRIPGQSLAVFVPREPLSAGQSRSYRLRTSRGEQGPIAAAAIRCRQSDYGLRIERSNAPVLQYNTAVVEPPDGIDGVYRRSGHIHPVWTPAGRMVTEEFPEDHPHQHAIFNAWVNTTFEGRAVDFWNEAAETGRVEHLTVEDAHDGNVFAQFRVQLRHSDLTHPDGPSPVLVEEMLVWAYDVPRGFLFDIESRQVCVAESPLTINEYHYGGMAFRGAAGWLGQTEHDFLTSEGKTRADGNHSRPVWVAAHGLVDGEECTLVVFGHPDNYRHPQPVRLHPSKPYFVFTPPVLGGFSIEPGTAYVARYRYLTHDGPPDPEWYDQMWQGIFDPPRTRVLSTVTGEQ